METVTQSSLVNSVIGRHLMFLSSTIAALGLVELVLYITLLLCVLKPLISLLMMYGSWMNPM